MAAGSGEVPVVPTEAAEEKEGEVSAAAAAVEKKGEGAVVSEVEKKGEGDMVSEVVSLSEAAEKVVSEALEKVVSEALEKAMLDAADKVVSEAAEKVMLDAAEKVVSEEVEKKGEESVEKAPAAEAGKREEEESGRRVTLESNDGEQVEVTEASARLSELIGEMIDSGSADIVIPLPDVDSKTLMKVIEYCDKHADKKSDNAEEKEELKNWDKAFIDGHEDTGSLVKVIIASNYLKIDGLHGLACQRVAETIKGKTLEEIFKAFNISE